MPTHYGTHLNSSVIRRAYMKKFLTMCISIACPMSLALYMGMFLASTVNAQTYTLPLTGSNTITTCSGTIRDNGGTGNYSSNANGYTVINPSVAGNNVRLTFTQFNTESGYDYVTVFNGVGTGGTILFGPTSGTTIPPAITSTSGPLTIRLTSDGSVVRAGFTAAISCVAPSTTYLVPLTGNNTITTCTGTIQDDGGNSNYSSNANGYTVINPSVGGNSVRLTFTQFVTEANYDYVTIFDGVGTGGTILYGPTSGSPALPTITSTSGPLTIRFTSDGSVVAAGFTADISCVTPPPATNDLVCNAQAVACGSTTPGTTVGFTSTGTDEGTTTCGTAQAQPGAWYSILGNGQLMTASLCATTGWDSKISIYSGTCTSLTCVGGTDDNGPACTGLMASHSWTSTNGVTYYIKVHGYSSNSAFSLSVTCTAPPTPPGNNDCANAVGLTVGANGSCPGGATAGTTAGATGGAPPYPSCLPTGLGIVDVWYSFNSGSNTAILHTIVLGTQTTFGFQVLTACGGTEVACGDGLPTGPFAVTPNTNYVYRAMTLATTTGTFTICLQAPPTPPANDQCAGAIAIPGTGPFPHLTTVVNNTNATDIGQPTPSCQANAHGSIWYNFTPACSGDYRFSTCQTDAPASGAIDHVLVVATGSCGGAFTEVACNDDATCAASNLSSIIPTISLTAGTTYRVIAYTYDVARGNIQIQTSMLAPTITSFSSANACTGSGLVIYGTNLACATSVTIGGTPATITANTSTSVTVTLGSGTTGPAVITCQAGTVSSAGGAGNVTIGQPASATFTAVDNCANEQFSVQVNVTSLGSGSSATLIYSENGVALSTTVGLGLTTVGPFVAGSEVICTIDNGSPGCVLPTGYLYSHCAVTVQCGTTLSVDHCYRNFDTRTFLFRSSTSETLTLTFVSGTMDPNDVIRGYSIDNGVWSSISGLTSTFAYLSGVSGTSLGDSLYVEIDSNGSNSCASGQQSSWTFEVECTPGCVDPDAVVSVVNNCGAYNFSINVDVLYTGDGTTTDLRYTVNGGSPQFVTGLVDGSQPPFIPSSVNIGPFAIGDVVNVRLLHESDASCDRNFGNFAYSGGCPSAENCVNALNLATQASPLPGSTVGRVNDFSYACGTATANTAPDAIYYMDVPNGAQFNIRQQTNNYNSQHYVRYGGACPGTTVIACVDDDAGEIGWVNWTNTTGAAQRVWWIQDGFGTGTGIFVLEWQLITCPAAPGNPTVTTGNYSICQNGTVPGGQGLGVTCAPIAQASSSGFPGSNFISEGTTITTRSTLVMPALPAGAVVTAARLKLFNVVANTGIIGLDGQRQNIRVALSGSFTLAETQLTTATGPGTVSPDPVINLTGFPAAGGTINLRTRQTADNALTSPDATIASALIEIDYNIPASVRWYTAPVNGTLVFTGPTFDPVGQGAVSNASPITTNFYAACAASICESIRAITTFNVNAPANAGSDGTLTICSNASAVSLLAQLGGSPQNGGVWTGPSTVVGGMYAPATMNGGAYTYTVTGNPPCANAAAMVTVTENPATLWYADVDGDGFGDPASSQLACSAPTSPAHVANNSDLCPTDPLKQVPGQCGCGVPDTDSDSDGAADCNDGCPNDPNKTTPGQCGCGVADTDDDNDGTANCNDGCPNDPLKTSPGICGCGVSDTDTDGDLTADCNDGCPNDPNKIAPGQCGCGNPDTDTDGDLTADCNDICPTVANGNPGDACDDLDPFTFNDMLGASTACSCAGTACTETVTIEMGTDGTGLRWTLRDAGNNTVVQSSPGYPAYDYPPASPNYTVTTCLPNGAFYFVFEDENCDGIVGGGYIVRVGGVRVIDNRTNLSGCPSQITGNMGVNVPVGMDRLITQNTDRLDLRRGVNGTCSDKLTANDTYGLSPIYQFWFYAPNGGLSFTYPASGPGSNVVSMASLPSLIDGMIYNVRVRSWDGAQWRAWGPAGRMRIDNPLGQCKITSLFDDTSSPNHSCGKTIALPLGNQGNSAANRITAWPVTRFNNNCVSVNANKYQFRFRNIAENVVIVRTSSSYHTFMTTGAGFEQCEPYDVEVRASFDGGATWCTGGTDPYNDLTPWGDICAVNTGGCSNGGGNQNIAIQGGSTEPVEVRMYPNPNRGDQLTLTLNAVAEGVNTVSVDIYDLFGKRASARTIAVNDGFISTVVDLHEMAAGMYMVNITAGEQTYTERLVIQP